MRQSNQTSHKLMFASTRNFNTRPLGKLAPSFEDASSSTDAARCCEPGWRVRREIISAYCTKTAKTSVFWIAGQKKDMFNVHSRRPASFHSTRAHVRIDGRVMISIVKMYARVLPDTCNRAASLTPSRRATGNGNHSITRRGLHCWCRRCECKNLRRSRNITAKKACVVCLVS